MRTLLRAPVIVCGLVCALLSSAGDQTGSPSGALDQADHAVTSEPLPTQDISDATPIASQLSSALPLGTYADAGASECQSGFACRRFRITCPGVPAAESGTYRYGAPRGQARGMVMFFSGGYGNSWWGQDRPGALSFLDELRNSGYGVVQVRWDRGWLIAPAEAQVGPAKLACRPATVVRSVYDTLYRPLGVGTTAQRCGFCLTGNSGGSSQVSYTLSHYGLESIVQGLFPTSGPVHTALVEACLNPAGDPLSYRGSAAPAIIDRSYGFGGNGPCTRGDRTYSPNWDRDSIETRGSDYTYPTTRVQVIVGDLDRDIHAHARAFVNRLTANGTPATMPVIAGMGHEVADYVSGRAALRQAIVQ